jgi:hypothetical protein
MVYLMHTQQGQVSNAFEEYGLYVVSLKGDVQAVRVDDRVAFGCDWNKDGERLAYLEADSPKQIIVLKKSDGTTRVLSKNWPSQMTHRPEDGQQKEERK